MVVFLFFSDIQSLNERTAIELHLAPTFACPAAGWLAGWHGYAGKLEIQSDTFSTK